MRSVRGLTLLELLIALALGLLLLGVMYRLYMMQYQVTQTLQDALFLQENSMLTGQFLTRTLRTAGFIGCMRLQKGMSAALTPENRLQIQSVNGNDEITVRQMGRPATSFKSNQQVIVSDCSSLQIVPASHLSHVNLQHKTVAPLEVHSFFLRKISGAGKSKMALYEKTEGDNAVELVPGVDQLRAQPVKNAAGQTVALQIFYHLTAPYGATRAGTMMIALREVIPLPLQEAIFNGQLASQLKSSSIGKSSQ